MQYTASSFSEMAAKLFAMAVSQRFDTPRSAGLFPARGMFRSRFPEGLLEQIIMPTFRGASYLFSFCRRLQHGEHQLYVLYIFVTLLLLMVWAH
jgi:type VI protein secretion system component VasK